MAQDSERRRRAVVLLGAAALMTFAFGAEVRPATICEDRRLPGGFRFTRLVGHGLVQPVTLIPNQIVLFHPEYRKNHPANTTRVDVIGPDGRSETIWILESRTEILRCMNQNFQLLTFPVDIGSGGEFEGPEGRDPSREVQALWVNRAHVIGIGPSPIIHFQRRRLGKIYLRNHEKFSLNESLNSLESLFEPEIKAGQVVIHTEAYPVR